ncbi:unnamed protein product [Urochloa decumbens]|uniref:CCHC-type domain-containing protein n=1 Tax=Urochloa decumbens TaxID=240449 RepID=A0ABC8ZSS7_9POAL
MGRCYNCLASDHRIAVCRDPPKCILCSRSGHKARLCPRRAPATPTAIWRPRAPAAVAVAPSTTPEAPVPATSASPSPAMNFIPGEACRRPARVTACAARTSEVREAERDLRLHALVAVQMDARAQLTCDAVLRDALQQLRIPQHALQVTRIATSSFLLRFQTPELCNTAHSCRALAVGRTALHLMPWGRHIGAAAAVSNLFYRARICFEGVPNHAQQIESVLHLLPTRSFVEGIDYVREKEKEKGCFILWVWCQDPDDFSVLGTLQVEQPMVLPKEYHYICAEAITLLSYDIIIHLDLVEDYNPPLNSPSSGSFESDTSGLPREEHSVQCPQRHWFDWHLGQPDALSDSPRASMHSRLGGRRDRSPPRGGGAGGFFQATPPNQYDMSRSTFGGAGPSARRNSNTGRDYQGWNRNHATAAEAEPEDSFCVTIAPDAALSRMDPMMDEVAAVPNLVCSRPMLPQCSVEPTAVEQVPAVPDLQVGRGDGAVTDQLQEQDVEEAALGGGAAAKAHPVSPDLNKSEVNNTNLQDGGLFSSPEPLFGCMFDLNLECEIEEELHEPVHNLQSVVNAPSRDADVQDRTVLGPAEGRLNKHAKDHGGYKAGSRGIARLAVPLKKSLLCPPAHKPKAPHIKKSTCVEGKSDGANEKIKLKGASIPLDEKATVLLMQASGIISGSELPTAADQERFGIQFVAPLQDDILGDMRNTFGLMREGGADKFSTLICDADVQDD